ncbi:MAG TPA: hypothetical protein VNY74_15100 [Edaphobacter sp.]|jgi:hypothetical protein|nr:hypothetical protein [Edaphobacter sp.]
MREIVARCIVAMGAGLALMAAQGCKKQAAPVQPVVVSSAPGVQPDFPIGPLPIEDVDTGAKPRAERAAARRRYQAQPVQAESTDAQAAAASAAQRRQDERLFQQQEAASQRQQEELNRDIEENVKAQQEMQAEPRIQDAPEAIPTQPQ